MDSISIIDLLVFFIYVMGITFFGISFFKKNRSSKMFITAGSKIPSWVVSFSIFATFVSSISYLALPGNAYGSNWNAFVFSLSLPIASVIAVKYFVPLYRKINSPSAYKFIEDRFGTWSRIYVSSCYLLTQVMRIGTILYLLGLTLNTFLDFDLVSVIILTGIIVAIYSIFGGIQAVVWTDAIQGILLIFGAIICIAFILYNSGSGPEKIFETVILNEKFSLGSFGLELNSTTFWVVLIYGLFINLQNFGIDQNYIQRYLLTESDSKAKSSALIGGLMYVPVSALFLFIGTILWGYYNSGEFLPEAISESPDKVFPYFIVNVLPQGISGLLIASIFSAGMSTLSTSYNSSATVILIDYYNRFFSNKQDDKVQMRILYIASLVVCFLGIIVALAMINVKSALDSWWELASIFSGGMLGLFLMALAPKIKHKIIPIISIIFGIISILILSIPNLFQSLFGISNPFHSYLTIVVGTSVIFLTGFFSSIFFDNQSKQNK